jgi:hypothetical protein
MPTRRSKWNNISTEEMLLGSGKTTISSERYISIRGMLREP